MNILHSRSSSSWATSAALGYDTLCAAIAISLALWLYFGENLFALMDRRPGFVLIVVSVYTAFACCAYVALGQHRQSWRFTSISELVTILRSVTATMLFFIPFVFIWTRAEDIPRSSILIAWLIHVGLLSAARLLARILFRSAVLEYAEANAFRHRIPVLVVGAGPQSQKFVRAVLREPNPVYQPFGAISADENVPKTWSINEALGHVPVLGTYEQFAQIVKQVQRNGVNFRHIVLADGALEPELIRQILPVASDHAISLLRVLSPDEQSDGSKSDSQVAPLLLQDALPRLSSPQEAHMARELLRGRRVLITGAGGSIGAELTRQVASAHPAKVGLLEKSEFNLYSIDEELGASHPELDREPMLCDVRDAGAVDRWFQKFQPEIVFHTAALKHVPMVEAHPLEGILTNVDGTRNIADACAKYGATAMVLISSDKAVNPVSVMGATKRLAESYCQALDLRGERASGCRFITVRFGNVLWSTGSVVTRFRRQLAEGAPLTVTHPEVTRYFMTIDDAVGLVLRACASRLRNQQVRGAISVLNMGKPIKILELARMMTMLAAKRPDIDVPIQYIGLRQGEKLSEELIHDFESLSPTEEDGILLASPRQTDLQFIRRDIDAVVTPAREGDSDAALRALQTCVPEYTPSKPIFPQMTRKVEENLR